MYNNLNNSLSSKISISKSKFKDIEPFIFAFCLFLLSKPFFVWDLSIGLFLICICALLALKNNKINNKESLFFFLAFIPLYLYIAVKNESNIFGIIALLFIPTFLISSAYFVNKVFKLYLFIFSISLIPSVITFILVNFLKIDLSYSLIEPLNSLKSYDYRQYPFFIQENSLLEQIFPRFFGYYDEPGVLGTISAILLSSSKFDLRKKINIPILISGILSLSLAFYVATLIYGFIFMKIKHKIIFALIVLGTIVLFYQIDALNTSFIDRFKYEDGKFKGDNRIADKNFQSRYEQYSKSNNFYFGLGEKTAINYNTGGSSYYDIIVAYGIILFLLFIALLVLRSYAHFKFEKEFFIYLLILILVFYQRPYINQYFYMFLIFSSVTFLDKNKTIELKS